MVDAMKELKLRFEKMAMNVAQRKHKELDNCFNISGSVLVSKRCASDLVDVPGSLLLKMERMATNAANGADEAEALKGKRAKRQQLPGTAKAAASDRKRVGGVDGGSGAKRARRT